MSKINGILKEEMPREKLMKIGPQNLTDVELLAIILRVGTRDKNVLELSREILSSFDMAMVSRKTFEELLRFKGVEKAKACQIVSVFELARRLSNDKKDEKIKIKSSKDIYEYVKSDYMQSAIEKVMVVFVNTKNSIIKKEIINHGSINYSVIEPRDIIKKTLDYNASGFFLVHNHPSGDCTPSQDDIETTKKIKEIADNLSIRFLDHIIIGDYYYSLFDNEIL